MWMGAGLLLCSALSAACAVILGFDPLVEGTEQPPDAHVDVPDAGGSDAAVAAPRCLPLGPSPLTSDGERTSRFFALESLRFRAADGGIAPGLDLDCVDTKEPERRSGCVLGSVPTEALDFGAGIDNTASRVLDLVEATSFDFGDFDRRVRSGDVGIIFQILGDFAQRGGGMTVYATPARGLSTATLGCGSRVADAAVPITGDAARPPQYEDRWCTDKRFKSGVTDESVQQTKEGWIEGDRFVAHFETLDLPLLSRGPDRDGEADDPVTYMTLHNVWITARIELGVGPGASRLREGTIAGRWTPNDILRLYTGAIDRETCGLTGVNLEYLGNRLCGIQDSEVQPGSTESALCDALSIGIGFDAYEVANDGEYAEIPVAVDPCFEGQIVDAGGGPVYRCPPLEGAVP